MKFVALISLSSGALLALILAYQYFAQKFGINTQPSQPQQFMITEETLYEYHRVCEALMKCINGNHAFFALCPPLNIVDHLLTPEAGIRTKNGKVYFVYQFSRELVSSVLEDDRRYNTTAAPKIAQRINDKLPHYCLMYGAPQVRVYKAIDGSDGAIRFVVGEWR